MQLPVVVIISCICRICKSEYRSLLKATACCKEAKAIDRREKAARQDELPVKFKTRQSNLGQFHHHEIDWQNLLSELEEFKKSQF